MSTMKEEAVTPAHDPATFSSVISLGATLVAVVMIAVSSILLAVLVGGIALVLYMLGLLSGNRLAIGFATGLLTAGLISVGSFLGASTEVMLIGIVATIIAWDVGENAINVGEQVGKNASTIRAQAIHAVSTATVGVLGGGIAYAISTAASGGKPIAGLFFLLLGVIVAGWFIRT